MPIEDDPWSALLLKIQAGEVPQAILLHSFQDEMLRHKAYDLAAEIILSRLPEAQYKIQAHIHPDIHEFSPSGKGRLHSIDLAREIKKDIWIPPFEAPYKVYIIEEADRMTLSAISAFLKVLEEPPHHAILILTSTKPQRLPATILSRTLGVFLKEREIPLPDQEAIECMYRCALEEIPITEVGNLVKGGPDIEKQFLRDKARKFLEVLLKLYRDRYMLDLGCFPSALSYPTYQDKSLLLPKLPLEKVLTVIESAYQALDNSSSAASVLEWVALQLLSLRFQAQKSEASSYSN